MLLRRTQPDDADLLARSLTAELVPGATSA